MTNAQCIEVLEYMCSKLGIDVMLCDCIHDHRKIDVTCKICNRQLYALNDLAANYYSRISRKSTRDCLLTAAIHRGNSTSMHLIYDGEVILAYFVSCVYAMKIDGIRSLRIGNPFFGFTQVLDCTSVEEAKIACDLHWPKNLADDTISKVNKEIEKLENDQMALRRMAVKWPIIDDWRD